MKTLSLDINYTDGDKNYLEYYDALGNLQKVFDATGGYGANLLGHKNPDLIQVLIKKLQTSTPSNVQGSIRKESSKLCQMISEILSEEILAGPWVTNLSNSGAEAVEAAIKHSLIYHRSKIDNEKFKVIEEYNELTKMIEGLDVTEQQSILDQLKFQLENWDLSLKAHDIFEALRNLLKMNIQKLESKPYLVAFENSFHGKTLGALSVTYNPKYKEAFFQAPDDQKVIFLPKNQNEKLQQSLSECKVSIIIPSLLRDRLKLIRKDYSKIAAIIVEPIQGEAGILEISEHDLKQCRQSSIEDNYLLIFDEIQSGLFRTGKMAAGSHSQIKADIYCFSKALGGGLTKIAATSFIKSKYVREFGLLHTSTFAEDDLSSSVAIEVLNILNPKKPPLSSALDSALYLYQLLSNLHVNYPNIIKGIRGKGLMIAVEINSLAVNDCYEFKIFCDHNLFGHMISSALLKNEKIRIAPTLSNQYALRIQPSVYLSLNECQLIATSLKNLAQAISTKNMSYFLGHLFPQIQIEKSTHIPNDSIKTSTSKLPVAVFLNHVIDAKGAKEIVGSLRNLSDEEIEAQLDELFEVLEFEIYFRGPLKGANGQEIDVVMMSLPVTSAVLHKNFMRDKGKLVKKKIQNALSYAKSLGATTVGLGQFTSIFSKRGVVLDPMGMNLTTGNSYTAALSIEATLQTCSEKNIDTHQTNLGLVGAAGNIVSVSANILADHFKKIVLFYHSSVDKNLKLANTVYYLLSEIKKSKANSPCVLGLKQALQANIPRTPVELNHFIQQQAIKKHFVVTSDINDLKSCRVLFTGASSSKPIIFQEHIAKDAIIVDVGVPANVDPQVKTLRPDVTVILGGIAALPTPEGITQFVRPPSYPLQDGEAFACMSETFILALSKKQHQLNIGHITRKQIEEIIQLAAKTGFQLAKIKTSHSM